MKKILVVEDDAQLSDVYSMLFVTAGYEVKTVGRGLDALSYAKSEHPSLVILDIMLPGGMNGFDVLEQMKLFEETKHIPVIVLTNLDTESDVAKKIGVDNYLLKVNTSNAELIAKAKAVLGD